MSNEQKSFVKGAAILGGIGLICKIIGALYRIPMTNMIGTEGMAIYQTAYPVYTFLLAISSAGIPVAVSRMVSARVSVRDYKAAHLVFQTAFKILFLIGIVTSIAMLALSQTLASAAGRPSAVYAMIMIAPALLLVSVMSAYRGYFQGLQMMSPTAFSQLIEQVGKLGVGLILAYAWMPRGVEYAAAGAVLGVTASEFISLVFMIVLYNRRKAELKNNLRHSVRSNLARRRGPVARELVSIALPIIIGACAMPLVQLADTAIVTNALLGIGYTQAQADSLFGTLTGTVNPLINMPAVLSLALAMSLVPAISASMASGDYNGVAGKSSFGFKLSLLVGLPCAVGFYMLSEPIIGLLYTSLSESELMVGGKLLSIMSVAVLFLTVVQTMTGVLQGLGRPVIPVINLFIGVGVKIAVSLVFIRMKDVNIMGAAIGTVACYVVAGTLDVIFAIRYSGMRFSLIDHLARPVLASGVMGGALFFLKKFAFDKLGNTAATLICIALCGVVYVGMVLAAGAIKKEDTVFLPGGARLKALMIKIKLWKSDPKPVKAATGQMWRRRY